MKRIAPHLSTKRGSILMLTLIVFMVILILGMTMITSILYSQGENTMQINEQKAYYAAFSAVEAVKAYFLNPNLHSSNTSPYELIGEEYTYNLKDLGVDEETTVKISIDRDEIKSQYILIQATGVCQGEESTVTAKMYEEVQEGDAGGIYSSEVVFASSALQINSSSTIKGNLYLGDIGNNGYTGTINNLNMVKTEETDSTVYIKSKNTFQFTDNNLTDVYIELEDPQGYMTILNNKADNMYITNRGDNNVGVQFQGNKVKGEAQLYLGKASLNMFSNTIDWRLVLGFNKEKIGGWFASDTQDLYIKGLQKYDESEGGVFGNITNKYIDERTEIKPNSGLIPKDLSYFDGEEERISKAISEIEELQNVLNNNSSWNKELVIQNAVLIDEEVKPGIPLKNYDNYNFDEYYDPNQNIRWVFSKQKNWDEEIVGVGAQGGHNTKYYLDNNGETVFFISEATRINMYIGETESVNNFYIYAPNSEFSFESNFNQFTGSIIARLIKAYKGPKEIEFKSPKGLNNTGAPGTDEGYIQGDGATSYTYYFEEYIEDDKN